MSISLLRLFPSPPSEITIATAFKGASFEYFGLRYRERLAKYGLTVHLRETAGAVENLRLLQEVSSGVQIGFVTGGVSDGTRAPGLLSLGIVFNQPYWLFYADTENIDNLSQLKGKRIAIGPAGSATRFSGETVLNTAGVNASTAIFLPYAGNESVKAFNEGKVDAIWIIGAPSTTAVKSLVTNPQARL